ncbi:MAG: EAL domain-containing protein [Betaproteobacteria bacterium]|nr:EAL domain-containing protein [Betaproteobacteria bacterium]
MDDPFLERMDSELAGWSDPVQRLRGALANNEFELYGQPILQFVGEPRYPLAEVLVRMREEERALIPPGEFLPVFEHYRMMPQLDRWVVHNTVKRLSQGSRIACYSVNLSSQTIEDVEFPRFVSGQLATHKVEASRLLFEIDETDTLVRPEATERFANQMKPVGTPLMIDSFGCRAVSFAPVKALAVQFVKVDGRITRKVLTSESARSRLNAILRVGERLGFGVIAECVEEQEVLLRLKAMGVGYAQGFGIYQPHPIGSL